MKIPIEIRTVLCDYLVEEVILMNKIEFSKIVFEARKAKKLSQKELADMLGVSNKSVSKWENAEAFPRDDTLDKLCSVLDINLDSDSDVNVEHERQLGELKRENDGLKSELLYLKTKRRRAVTVTVIASVLCLAVAAVIAFMISPDNRNNKVSGIGNKYSVITFAETKYYPADETFSYYMKSSDFNPQNVKYAELSLNGEESKVTVLCDECNDSIICSKQGGNTYYYLKEAALDFTVEDFDSFQLYSGSVANNTPKYEFSKNADEYWHGGLYDNEEAVAFLNYYNSPKKEVDSKKTEQYLGNNSYVISAEFSFDISANYDLHSAELGEFFTDGEGNIFFYDYRYAAAYEVNGEVSDNVKELYR